MSLNSIIIPFSKYREAPGSPGGAGNRISQIIGNRSGIGKANTIPVTDGSASVFIDNLATDAANISELKYPATPTAWA